MTKEDKELLLKDLCARLPYGVFVKDTYNGHYGRMCKISQGYVYYVSKENCNHLEERPRYIKPYLRSMSSMTKKEHDEYSVLYQKVYYKDSPTELDLSGIIEWLNEHHFDYRGLIEKGLALEAPKDMYV